jgi:hypothetical protein
MPFLFEKYKQTTAMTYIRRKREIKQQYFISKQPQQQSLLATKNIFYFGAFLLCLKFSARIQSDR